MSKFQCTTCNEILDSEAMMKHLSSTRHKTVIDAFNEEGIYCEDCQNSNVHQLQIIRFGGEDMSLLCSSCLNKEYGDSEKPTTAYSLSNGSLLKFWDAYLKVRDCCCEECGNESHLNVDSGRHVFCNECLKKKPESVSKRFISEDSGRFLYLFLGIKETGNTKKSKKRGRRLGRSKKSRNTGKAKPRAESRKLTVHEKLAETAFQNKKSNNAIESDSSLKLRTFTGHAAASGSQTKKKAQSQSHTTVKSQSQGKSRVKQSGRSDKKSGSKDSGKSLTSNGKLGKEHKNGVKSNLKSNESNSSPAGNNKTKKQSAANDKPITDKHKGNNAKSHKSNSSSDSSENNKKKRQDTASDRQATDKRKGTNVKSPKSNSSPGKSENNKTKKQNIDKDKRVEDNVKSKSKSKSNVSESNKTKKQSLAGVKGNNKKQNTNNKGAPNVEKQSSQDSNLETMEEYEEGEPLREMTKYVPKLTYSDPDDYFNTYSYALYLEEKLQNKFLQNFQITWPKNDEERVFVLKIDVNNNSELSELLPKNALKFGRPPFGKLRALILATQNESTIWYLYVKESEMNRHSCKILLELYPWNKNELPIHFSNDQLKILPCGAQTSRIYFAMTRAKNPRFIDLIMGQKPIKQINFTNRINYSKDNFNESQKNAIQHVLNNNVTILQGPPGTGKTSTIEELIIQMIRNFSSWPILCVAASNIAIDNIAEKFIDNKEGIRILRIVSASKESQYNMNHPLGKICLHNIVNDQLPPQLKEVQHKLRTGKSHELSKKQYNNLSKSEVLIADRHIMQAQILFTTTITAGGGRLKAIKELPVVIMDESTQSSEASTLVPLTLPGIRKFVFVGDEKQLSSFSQVPQLQMSLFERVLLNGSYKNPHMLDTQYRMHPVISDFPRQTFYRGLLKDGVTKQQKSWKSVEYPLFFLRCNSGNETRIRTFSNGLPGYSYINQNECQLLLKVIHNLILKKKVPRDQIGIIAPYSAQRDAISEFLVFDAIVNPQRLAMQQEFDETDPFDATAADKKKSINIVNGIYIATVDSFQGHEKHFILFSTVRSNPEGKVGFVNDARRMNVALTRAKNGLIVIGDDHTLRNGSDLWRSYIDYLNSHQLIFNDLGGY